MVMDIKVLVRHLYQQYKMFNYVKSKGEKRLPEKCGCNNSITQSTQDAENRHPHGNCIIPLISYLICEIPLIPVYMDDLCSPTGM